MLRVYGCLLVALLAVSAVHGSVEMSQEDRHKYGYLGAMIAYLSYAPNYLADHPVSTPLVPAELESFSHALFDFDKQAFKGCENIPFTFNPNVARHRRISGDDTKNLEVLVARNRATKTAYVGIRGTYNFENILTDVKFLPTKAREAFDNLFSTTTVAKQLDLIGQTAERTQTESFAQKCEEVEVHRGILAAYAALDPLVIPQISQLVTDYDHIIISGHSLGGGLAILTAMHATKILGPTLASKLRLVTLAAPRLSPSESFTTWAESSLPPTIHYQAEYDLAPTLLPHWQVVPGAVQRIPCNALTNFCHRAAVYVKGAKEIDGVGDCQAESAVAAAAVDQAIEEEATPAEHDGGLRHNGKGKKF